MLEQSVSLGNFTAYVSPMIVTGRDIFFRSYFSRPPVEGLDDKSG